MRPISLFQGYLEFDGVPIYPGMTVRELNSKLKLKTRNWFHCMSTLKNCGTFSETEHKIMSINISTDGSRYDSRIYQIQFSSASDLRQKTDKRE